MRGKCLAAFVVLALSGCARVNQPSDQTLAAPRRDLTPAEKALLGHLLAQSLKDPDSAKFKWMPLVLSERDGVTDYCGLVNGKNSYGGYAGYVRFMRSSRKTIKANLQPAPCERSRSLTGKSIYLIHVG
jgi:hypothetical protein